MQDFPLALSERLLGREAQVLRGTMQHAFEMRLQEFQNEQLLVEKYAVAVEREAKRFPRQTHCDGRLITPLRDVNGELLIEIGSLDFPEGDKARYSQGRCEIPPLRIGDERVFVSVEFHYLFQLLNHLEMPSGAVSDPSREQVRLVQ